MIRVSNIRLKLGEFSLEDVSLQVQDEEYFVLLGPTGSGKTVLTECIAGLNKPKNGSVWINGRDVTGFTPEEREVSYVPQDYALFPFLNVKENIEFGMKIKKCKKAEVGERLGELTRFLGIGDLLSR
ncbi:MAG: ATP-binding cassette domain-containing protein, partial [Candidatus Altiarchaeota archaeon]|nr:ATP-binding cassette domain-containing protein [Candidatus Altiarchaeota archaeon]